MKKNYAGNVTYVNNQIASQTVTMIDDVLNHIIQTHDAGQFNQNNTLIKPTTGIHRNVSSQRQTHNTKSMADLGFTEGVLESRRIESSNDHRNW